MTPHTSTWRAPFRRTWLLLPVDLLAIVLSLILSFQLRFSWHIPSEYVASLRDFALVSIVIYGLVFLTARLYTRIWRYASIRDMEAIATACTVGAIIIKVLDFTLPNVHLPQSVWLLSYLITMALVAATRISIRLYYQPRPLPASQSSVKRTNVLIYGAGSAGSIVVKEANKDASKPWFIVGFVDDDKDITGLTLNGFKVLGTRNDLPELTQRYQVDKIVLAIPSLSRHSLRELVDELQPLGIPVLIIPPYTRWAVDNLYSQIRPVDVEDLLGREPLPVDVSVVGSYLRDARVLVTGSGGSIGSEICRQVAALRPKELILLGRGENSIFEIHNELKQKFNSVKLSVVVADIRDERKMAHVFGTMRPHVVFHAAAHKHVPLMEQHPDEALINNVMATKTLTELASEHRVGRFIFISSDKAVRPSNVMGASKRIAEMVVQNQARRSSSTVYLAVRFGNVLGSRGSVVPIFRQQISTGGPVTITDERMTRYFMTIPEAVRLVVEAGAVGTSGHVYLFDMGEPVRIIDLARRMIQLSGFRPDIDVPIEFTGIRPGEKLFEELTRETDDISVDPNGRIWEVSCPAMQPNALEVALSRLYSLYLAESYDELAATMKQLAWWEPDYAHQAAVTLDTRRLMGGIEIG